MKRNILLLGILMISFLSIAQSKLPKVMVETLKGEQIELSSFLSDSMPIVISFWGTTCKPCLMELDALAEVFEEWNNEVKFKVIAVATDDSRAASKVRVMASGRGWPFQVVLDKNQELKRIMNVNVIPQLFVFNRKGEMVYSHSGYTPGSELEIYKVLKGIK